MYQLYNNNKLYIFIGILTYFLIGYFCICVCVLLDLDTQLCPASSHFASLNICVTTCAVKCGWVFVKRFVSLKEEAGSFAKEEGIVTQFTLIITKKRIRKALLVNNTL